MTEAKLAQKTTNVHVLFGHSHLTFSSYFTLISKRIFNYIIELHRYIFIAFYISYRRLLFACLFCTDKTKFNKFFFAHPSLFCRYLVFVLFVFFQRFVYSYYLLTNLQCFTCSLYPLISIK